MFHFGGFSYHFSQLRKKPLLPLVLAAFFLFTLVAFVIYGLYSLHPVTPVVVRHVEVHTPNLIKFPLRIFTVANSDKMPEMRELAGSMHRVCELCSLHVFHAGLQKQQLEEMKKWTKVKVEELATLLPSFSYDVKVIPNVLLHAMKDNSPFIFVDSSFVFTTVDKLMTFEPILKKNGHVLIRHEDPSLISCANAFFQAYYSNTMLPMIESLVATFSCIRTDFACISSNALLVPYRFGPKIVSDSDIPMKVFDRKNNVIEATIECVASLDVDINNKERLKPYNPELEIFHQASQSFLKFHFPDILEDATIIKAVLVVSLVWIGDEKGATVTMKSGLDYGSIILGLVGNTWNDDFTVFNDRPKLVGKTVFHSIDYKLGLPGSAISFDISDLIASSFKERTLSVTLFGNRNLWYKFHSRYSKVEKFRPVLKLTVKGQGAEYRNIKVEAK